MLPVAKTVITGITSLGAGMIASSLFGPFYKNANGIQKILLWFGGLGLGVAASNLVQREVGKTFDDTVAAVKEARNHVEIED